MADPMRITVSGRHLPGRSCGRYRNVHVGLQVGSHYEDLVPGDAEAPEWHAEVRVISREDGIDFAGRAVHGRPCERFLYLTWGELDGETFSVFRRAKLMLADVVTDPSATELRVEVDLTDVDGMPRCARVRDAAVAAR